MNTGKKEEVMVEGNFNIVLVLARWVEAFACGVDILLKQTT